MKQKILSILKKIQSGFTVKMHKMPVVMTLVMLMTINVILILVGGWIAMLLDPATYSNYLFAIISAGKWMIIPNSILTVEKIPVMVLALVMTLIGMVLFTGTIIGLATNSIRAHLTVKANAKGKLKLSNHMVILNYNAKVCEILLDLMYNGQNDTVLVLSDKTKDEIHDDLLSSIALTKEKPNSKLSLIVRTGDSTSEAELEGICLNSASKILIMDKASSAETDLDALKHLLQVATLAGSADCQIGLETESFETVEVINNLKETLPVLKGKNIVAFSYNRKLGQLLAQSVTCPNITNLVSSLLSFRGCEFYPTTVSNSAEEILQNYENVVPVAFNNEIYVLKDDSKLKTKRKTPFVCDKKLKLKTEQINQNIDLYIIGENNKMPYLLNSLSTAKSAKQFAIKTFAIDEKEQFLEAVSEKSKNKKIAMILSDDKASPEAFDANVFEVLISIYQNIKEIDFEIITEILNPDNLKNIKNFAVSNVIVSNKIVSYFALQTLFNKDSYDFYENLFEFNEVGTSGFDLKISTASELFDLNSAPSFENFAEFISACYFGSDKKIMPIGIYFEKDVCTFLCEDTDKPQKFALDGSQNIAYICFG